jgi:hypothetical protein
MDLLWGPGPGGCDRHMLKANEIQSNDFSQLSYNDTEKMALRHYESATMPAKVFSKFIQNNKNT